MIEAHEVVGMNEAHEVVGNMLGVASVNLAPDFNNHGRRTRVTA